MKKKLTMTSVAALTAALILTPAAFAAPVPSYPGNTGGWVDISTGGGTATYAQDAPNGFGDDSLQLKTTADNSAKATYAHKETMALNDVMAAGYWTKQVATTSDGGSASYIMSVDLDGNGTWDTNLVYEPYWQNEASPDAAPVTKGEWQQWDVASGLFWSSRSFGSGETALQAGAGGAPFYTLADIKANYPQAQLQGIAVNVGSYNPDYTINVDGVTLNNVTYNFESSAPAKAPKNNDECKTGGWQTLSRVDGSAFKNQGQCVSYVASGKAAADAKSMSQ